MIVDYKILIIGFVLAGLIGMASYRLKSLSLSGLVGTVIIGTIVFGLGQLMFSIPLLFFFISGSMLSSVKNERKTTALEIVGKAGPRNIWQILANGGLAAAAVLMYEYYQDPVWFYIFIVVLAEATADTWATEIGTLANVRPVSIIGFNRIDTGQSGGVTRVGSLASVVGAFCLAIGGYGVWEIWGYGDSLGIDLLALIFLTGLSGAFFDSILGGTIQAQYKCRRCEKITEKHDHCGQPTDHISGLKFINNDVVNFLSTLFSALLFLAIYRLLYIV